MKSSNTHQPPILLASGGGEEGTLLLSRIPGRDLREREINQKAVQQAADFVVSVSQADDSKTARSTPMASDACCAIIDHLNARRRPRCPKRNNDANIADVPTLAFLNDELENRSDKKFWAPL